MYITVQGLVLFMACFVIFCLLVAAAVYFIITLSSLNTLLKHANSLLKSNEDNIGKSLAKLPETIGNVNDLAVSMKGNSDKVGATIDGLGDAMTETAAVVSEGTEDIISIVNIIGNVAKVIISLFEKSGEKK